MRTMGSTGNRTAVSKGPSLVLVSRQGGRTCYRTADNRFQVFGEDLNTRGGAGGAGPVWSWRPARLGWEWSDDLRPFATKAGCLRDLTTQSPSTGHGVH
jgi:hypothetical protein